MSAQEASKFIAKLYERDAVCIALLPEGVTTDNIGLDEVTVISKTAKDAGWDFTAEEFQEAYLDSLSLSQIELASVAAG